MTIKLGLAVCSCAAICNEHNAEEDEVGWWGLWWFSLAIPWFCLLVDNSQKQTDN